MSSLYRHPIPQPLEARHRVGRLGSTVQLLYLYMSSPYLHPVPQPLEAWRWVGGLSGTVQLDRFASGGEGELGTTQNLRHVDFCFERGEVHLGKGQLV